MKTFILTVTGLFAFLVFFGCQGQKAFVISHKVTDRPLLVFPSVKRYDWDKELEAGLVHFEGFRSRPYYCSAGVRTIGYGCTDKSTTRKAWISEKEARALLLKEVEKAKAQVLKEVQVELSENQLNALTSFTFNCGVTNLRNLVNGEDRLNAGNYKSVEKILPLYRKAGGKVRKGLELRRAWELNLWKGEI